MADVTRIIDGVAVHTSGTSGAPGTGSPLVLLHGNGGDHRDFAAVAGRLAEHHTVHAVDWPGWGASAPDGEPTALDYAALLPRVLRGIGAGPFVLVGNSVGGFAAIRVAATDPDLVRALVLVDPGGFTPRWPGTVAGPGAPYRAHRSSPSRAGTRPSPRCRMRSSPRSSRSWLPPAVAEADRTRPPGRQPRSGRGAALRVTPGGAPAPDPSSSPGRHRTATEPSPAATSLPSPDRTGRRATETRQEDRHDPTSRRPQAHGAGGHPRRGGAAAAPALAATTVPIQIGNTGETIGTATFTRTLQGDGTERIAMTLDVTGSGRTLDEVHVCVGADPFTGRIPPGRCRFGVTGLSGTTFTRDLDLGTEYVGRRVCLQPHLEVRSTDGRSTDTGYAGWVSGKPFFGSLCFESVGTEVPLGATGVLGLSALLAAGLGVVALGRRRTGAPFAR